MKIPGPRKTFSRTLPRRLLPCLLPLVICGCYSLKLTEPQRSVIEQLVLSRASEQAMQDTDLDWLRGKKIYVEEKYFEGYDKGYSIGVIRDQLSRSGALLMKADTNAEVIVEIRSGGASLKTSETFFGVPSMTVPIPLATPVQTPEVAFYKHNFQEGIAKFTLFAYVRESGEHLNSMGIADGRAHFHLYKLLGVSWERTDIPELKKHAGEKQRDSHSR